MAIYDANNLDIEAIGKDGSIELFIISSGKFDDSNEQQSLLMDKIENLKGTYIKLTGTVRIDENTSTKILTVTKVKKSSER